MWYLCLATHASNNTTQTRFFCLLRAHDRLSSLVQVYRSNREEPRLLERFDCTQSIEFVWSQTLRCTQSCCDGKIQSRKLTRVSRMLVHVVLIVFLYTLRTSTFPHKRIFILRRSTNLWLEIPVARARRCDPF